jgi:hypothetical protein
MNYIKKGILLILMIMSSVFSFSQTIIPPSPIVGIGYGVEEGQTITVDSLNFRDDQILLMQDNSTLIIRYKVTGKGIIHYGDVGDDVPKSGLVPIERTLSGFTWTDYRDATDVNPKVVFLSCQDPTEFQLTFGEYVDYQYELSPQLNVDVPGTLLSCTVPSLTLTANSSDTNVSYLWSTGETTPNLTVSAAGIYNVTITNSNGCSVTSDDIAITQDINVPIADAGPPQSINCIVSQVVLGNPDVEPNVVYSWNNGETTPQITVTTEGTYTLTATNTITGCKSTDVVVVTKDIEPPVFTVTSDQPSFSCVVREIVVTANTGTSTYSYLWENGQTTPSITVNQPGIYGVTVTDTKSGCESYQNIILDDTTKTIVATSSGDTEICSGESVTLSAFGGTEFFWENTGETTQNITVSPTSTTVYRFTVTENGCSAQGQLTVTVFQQPVATVTPDMTIFAGESRELTASGGSSYEWSTGETGETITVNPSVTTTYTVTVYNGNCSSTAQVTVTVVTPPDVIANAGNDIVICNGDNVILSVNEVSGATYLWSNGMTTPTITVTPLTHTVYTVTITANGKSDTDYVMVRVNNCGN